MGDYNEGIVVGHVFGTWTKFSSDQAIITMQYAWSVTTNRVMRLWEYRNGGMQPNNQPQAWVMSNGSYVLRFFWAPNDIADVVDPPVFRLTCAPNGRSGGRAAIQSRLGLYVNMGAVADGSGIPTLRVPLERFRISARMSIR